jgi:ABC-type lipoprotein release transport system permease subunit
LSVVVMNARSTLRRHLRSSLAIVLFAGLAAALPLSLWSAGRRAATAVDDFIARSGAPDVAIDICPPGFDPQAAGETFTCNAYEPISELELIRSQAGVRAAARVSWTAFRAGIDDDPSTWQLSTMLLLRDAGLSATALGDPVIVAGRMADLDAPDEVLVTEVGARVLGDLRPGDQVFIQGVDPSNLEQRDDRPPVISTVVGIVRTPNDLLPLDSTGVDIPTAAFYARAGWSRANSAAVPVSSNSIAAWLPDGDRDGFVARLQALLGDRALHSAPMIDGAQRSTIDQATDFESNAAVAVAVLLAVATAFFVGQTVSRQARSESSEWPTLRALGMTRRELTVATVLRWFPVVVGAATVTVVFVLAASAAGPVGAARRGPWERGVQVDWLVLLVGAPCIGLLVLVGAASVLTRRRPRRPSARRRVNVANPAIATGVAFARRSLGGASAVPVASAIAGVALAMAALVVTASGASSLHRVTTTPQRFGASWDAFVGVANSSDDEDDIARRVAEVAGVDAAAMIPGAPVALAGRELWVQSFVPIDGVAPIRPVITEGRAPASSDEIALGSVARRRAGVDLGDEVHIESGVEGVEPRTFRVVGSTMVTDGFEPNVGIGGIVTPDGLERLAPEATGAAVARAVSGPGRAEALDALRAAFPDSYLEVPLPSSLRNAERVAGLPGPFAVGGVLIASVTLAHALLLAIRRQRREIAVCRVLGFTRSQVRAVVATEATIYGLVGGAVGLVAGLVVARWGWHRVADGLGVASNDLVVPLWFVGGCALGVVVVANLLASLVGHRATRSDIARSLRAE